MFAIFTYLLHRFQSYFKRCHNKWKTFWHSLSWSFIFNLKTRLMLSPPQKPNQAIIALRCLLSFIIPILNFKLFETLLDWVRKQLHEMSVLSLFWNHRMKVLSARIKWSLASALDLFWTPLDTKSGALGMDVKGEASKGKKLKSRLSLYQDIARPLYNSQR